MTPTTVSRLNNALQTLFPDKLIRKHGMMDQAFWNYLPKSEDFGGRDAKVQVQISTGGRGNSHDFDEAQAGAGGGDFAEFTYTRVRDYKITSFDNEALEASEKDPGGLLSLKKLEIEGNLDVIVQRLGSDLHSVDGNCGTVSAVGTNTIDVEQKAAISLEIGAKLVSSPSTFTAVRPGGPKGYMVILAIDLDIAGAGLARITLDTTNGDTSAAYAVTAADRIYIKGNFGNSLTSTEQWVPTVRTGLGTAFLGVDRSVYPSRLAGIFFDGTTFGLGEALERGLARARLEGTTVDTVWVSVNRFTDIELDLGTKATRETVTMAEFGYTALRINSAGGKGGSVRIMCDPNLADTTALGTTKEAWKFRSLNGAPRNLTRRSGSDMIVEPARDGWQIRHGWYGNLVCLSPKDNIRWLLPS